MCLHLNVSIFVFVSTFALNIWAYKQEKLTNKHLVIAAEPWPPYITMRKNENGKVEAEGFYWDYVKFWLKARNCTFNLMISPYGTRGHCPKPNNCTGLIGMVNRNEVDFAIGMLK